MIHHLVCDEDTFISLKLGRDEVPKGHLSFRLCMANVLISACQKVPRASKKPFVSKILPRVLHSVEVFFTNFITYFKSSVLFFGDHLLLIDFGNCNRFLTLAFFPGNCRFRSQVCMYPNILLNGVPSKVSSSSLLFRSS